MSEERKHSILAPSSKEWVHCGFSAKFLANKEEETNDASEFGTECHALAEAYIKQSLKIEDFDEEPVSIDELKSTFKHYDDEMETLATGYANFVIGQADYEEKRTGKKPLVFVEQLLEMDYAPDTHGTADAIIIAGDTLTIIDNKTGFIPVKIFEGNELNSQLGIYGLYAYKLFVDIYPIKKIRFVIYQERIHNIDDQTIDVEDLLEWETLMTHLLLWGNAYAQIIRNGKGEVIALYPLMPNKMKPSRLNLKKYVFFSSGLSKDLDLWPKRNPETYQRTLSGVRKRKR